MKRLVPLIVVAWAVGLLWGMSCPVRLPVWTVYLGMLPAIPAAVAAALLSVDIDIWEDRP